MIALETIEQELSTGEQFRVVFLGDSVTFGDDTHSVWTQMIMYVLRDKLSDLTDEWKNYSWNFRIINSGFDGATSADLLNLLKEGALAYKPKMVFCMIGKNDRLFDTGSKKYRENVSEILSQLKANVRHVIFASSAPSADDGRNLKYKEYVTEIKKLFPMDGVEFVDVFTRMQELDFKQFFTYYNRWGIVEEGIKPGGWDFLHPNTVGQAFITKIFLKDVFGIDFNAEKYARDVLADVEYPDYDPS